MRVFSVSARAVYFCFVTGQECLLPGSDGCQIDRRFSNSVHAQDAVQFVVEKRAYHAAAQSVHMLILLSDSRHSLKADQLLSARAHGDW